MFLGKIFNPFPNPWRWRDRASQNRRYAV